ncbi:aldo/keto reductase [Anaeromyxobacter sp. SG17]|uniref:aldo/keto reductase n=1 Tax=Anaeromyxobacter sp. SG17 TaxID=2925405 RepID=UPI001F56F25E|nr:aldo/keto reductase [Anaeromyxobacter sp. SG17]
MKTRRLGSSDLDVTVLGFGAWAVGGGQWEFAWGPQDDAASIAAIRRALDRGVNWIDTAAVYGLGHSEEVVARALEGVARRPYVFTKCSMVWDERGKIGRSLRADSVRRECEASLRRLRVDAIDLYQIHWPVQDPAEMDEGWSTLAALKQEGKVRFVGVSNYDCEQLRRACDVAPVTSVQPRYSLLHRDVEQDLLPYCREDGIGVIAYSPMGAGLLTGKMTRARVEAFPEDDWRRRNPDFQEPRLSRNLALQGLLGRIGARHGTTAAAAAVAWTLLHPAVTGAIVGARSAEQVDGFVAAADLALTNEDVGEIERFLLENP